MDKSILEVVHQSACDLYDIGLMDQTTMREFDAMCLPPVKKYTAMQIKQIRKRSKASQTVFASYLNISASTIQKWEQGKKQPTGASLKLLSLVDRKGLDVLA